MSSYRSKSISPGQRRPLKRLSQWGWSTINPRTVRASGSRAATARVSDSSAERHRHPARQGPLNAIYQPLRQGGIACRQALRLALATGSARTGRQRSPRARPATECPRAPPREDVDNGCLGLPKQGLAPTHKGVGDITALGVIGMRVYGSEPGGILD